MTRMLFVICMMGLLGSISACQTTGAPPLENGSASSPTREIYLEKSDARAFAETEWIGVWRNAKYSNTGNTKAVARFHTLPTEGLYSLGQVLGEFTYHNPPGVRGSNGLGFVRYPEQGYVAGFISNGKLRMEGDKMSKSVWMMSPGCLAIITDAKTDDGYAFTARFERCDAVRFAGIFDRLNAIATAPAKGAIGVQQ